jgi:hypothetical protein
MSGNHNLTLPSCSIPEPDVVVDTLAFAATFILPKSIKELFKNQIGLDFVVY